MFVLPRIMNEAIYLTELPSVSAVVTHDEGRHRFISGSGLELVVSAVFLLALAAF